MLSNKVAIVTGAARGIGAAVARLLCAQGALVVCADISQDNVEETASQLVGATWSHLDVTDESSWQTTVSKTVAEFGRVDVLVNCAGIYKTAPIVDTTLELFERIVRVNQTGTFLGIKAVVAPMAASGGGSIVNLSSTSGLRGNENSMAYGSTKWAVRGMTKVAAAELGRLGIRVNSVHPGLIDTPMTQGEIGATRMRAIGEATPLRRAGAPEEVAAVVAFLASDAAAYVTGAEYTVDGGSSSSVMRTVFKP